jgi:hypothetical protein
MRAASEFTHSSPADAAKARRSSTGNANGG